MLHLIPVMLTSGLVVLGWQSRPSKPTLVEQLIAPYSRQTEIDNLSLPTTIETEMSQWRVNSTFAIEATPAATFSLFETNQGVDIAQSLGISGGTLGLALFSIGVPWVRLLMLPSLFYLDFHFLRTAYIEWQAGHRLGIATNDAVLATGLLLTGQWGANAFFATFYFTSRLLQHNVERALTDKNTLLPQDSPASEGQNTQNCLPLRHVEAEIHKANPDLSLHTPPQDLVLPALQPSIPQAKDALSDETELLSTQRAHRPLWQQWNDWGALPLLTISAVSLPFLGSQRTLAVLLTNFGYDYRLTAPISTLSYLSRARTLGINLANGQILEQLEHVDFFILDLGHELVQASTPPIKASLVNEQGIIIFDATTVPTYAEFELLIEEIHVAGRKVAYLCSPGQVYRGIGLADCTLVLFNQTATVHTADNGLTLAELDLEGVDGIINIQQPADLERFFTLLGSIHKNRRRGLAFAFAPSVINLCGIYFGHFGVVSALLVDYGGTAVGMLNALQPRLYGPHRHADHQLTP